jgi:hypothetical protein
MGDTWDDLLGNSRCEEIDFGTRYGKPRRSRKLPRKLKKLEKRPWRLSVRWEEFAGGAVEATLFDGATPVEGEPNG